MGQRSKGKAVSVGILAMIALIGAISYALLAGSQPKNEADRISTPEGVALCSHFGIDQTPYLSAAVAVKAASPLKSIAVYINGAYEGTSEYSYNSPNYSTMLTMNPVNPSQPIIPQKTYEVKLVATFNDGTVFATNETVVAC
jgi:hypothetical protein